MLEFLNGSGDKWDIDKLLDNAPLDCAVTGTPPQPAPLAAVCASSKPHPFAQVTPQELERLIAKNHNKNTAKSTETWVNQKAFERWRITRQIGQKLEEVPKELRLDGVLQVFFAEVHKNDGNNYEPDSLRTMLAAFDRHL